MRDQLLFAVFPYIGLVVFVVGCTVPLIRQRVDREIVPTAGRGTFDLAWRLALAVVAIGHVLTLGFPAATLRWDREFVRLVLLEGTRIAAGCLVVAGAVAVLARLLRPAPDRTAHAVDVVAATLLLTATASGLAIAILYRWASAWAAVTLAPYLSSIARFDPATDLVTRLPVLVKLHVVSAIAVVTILPLTSPARAIAGRLALLVRRRSAARQALDESCSWGRDAQS